MPKTPFVPEHSHELNLYSAIAIITGVEKTPDWYAEWRATLDIDTVEYGIGGIKLFRPDEML